MMIPNKSKLQKSISILDDIDKLSDCTSIQSREVMSCDEINPRVQGKKSKVKSYIVAAYEPKNEFYDDDISPLIGYCLLACAFVLFVIG